MDEPPPYQAEYLPEDFLRTHESVPWESTDKDEKKKFDDLLSCDESTNWELFSEDRPSELDLSGTDLPPPYDRQVLPQPLSPLSYNPSVTLTGNGAFYNLSPTAGGAELQGRILQHPETNGHDGVRTVGLQSAGSYQPVIVIQPSVPRYKNTIPPNALVTLACFATWCCGCILGLIAFGFAVTAERSTNISTTKLLRGASLAFSITGIAVGAIVIFTVATSLAPSTQLPNCPVDGNVTAPDVTEPYVPCAATSVRLVGSIGKFVYAMIAVLSITFTMTRHSLINEAH